MPGTLPIAKQDVYEGVILAGGGQGVKSLPGALVGDKVVNISAASAHDVYSATLTGLFEPSITVNDQIQQLATVDLGNCDPLNVFLTRPSPLGGS